MTDPVVEDEPLVTIAVELRHTVVQMLKNEPRMKGIARYLASVEIFWSRAIDTACAGTGFIFFNPDFWDKLPEETRLTVIAHEVWHLILKHVERGVGYDPDLHNQAADHIINNVLEHEGFIFDFGDPPWFTPCLDHRFKAMSTEQVYDILLDERKNNPNSTPPPPDGVGTPKHVPTSVLEDLVKAAADTVANNDSYKNVGKQAAEDKEKLDDLKESLGGENGYRHIVLEITDRKVPVKNATYEEIFEPYLIDPISGARRSFMRPNRRQHGIKNGLRLPGRVKRKVKSNRLAHMIYCLDVSGSINDDMKQTFHDSVRTIKELLNPNLLTVLFWDTEIKLIKTFKDTEPYGKIEIESGGCTSLDAVYAYCANRKPEAVVIFTDLAVIIPPKPKWDSIWLLTERHHKENAASVYGSVYIIPEIS
jgi:hypothetical protein